jgi:hypothetical protein
MWTLFGLPGVTATARMDAKTFAVNDEEDPRPGAKRAILAANR